MVDNSLSDDYRVAQFEKSIASRDSLLRNNKLKDKERILYLESSIAERDSIIRLQKQLLARTADYNILKNRLAALEIYEFLGKHDEAVLTTDFKDFDVKAIPVSSCNQTHYFLIKKIHSVNDILTKIETDISDAKINKFVENGVDKEVAKQMLYKSAEKDLIDADNKMTEIDGMDLSVLSPEQQKFYGQTLILKYRAIYSRIYPQ
jgi:hypothetical protein